jgi:hypothetical protein
VLAYGIPKATPNNEVDDLNTLKQFSEKAFTIEMSRTACKLDFFTYSGILGVIYFDILIENISWIFVIQYGVIF